MAFVMVCDVLAGDSGEETFVAEISGGGLFVEYCAVCHGGDARGGGPLAATLSIAPPNAIYASKLEMGSKGHFMAYVGIAQSLGRTLGPLVGGAAVSVTATHFWPIGVVCFTTWSISSVTMVWLWDKMKIENISSSSQDNDDLDQQERGASFSDVGAYVSCDDEE